MDERTLRQGVLGLIVIVWAAFIVTSFVRRDEIDALIWGVPTAAWVVLHTKKEDDR